MEKGREYGIDFIRIYAMCLVIMGHIIGRGGTYGYAAWLDRA